MASVTRPSSLASRPLRSASMRSRGCGTWVNGVPVSSPIGLAVPCANTARMPLSTRPSTARSACSSEVMLWHQSTSVVTPASICASAPIRLAM